MASTGTDLQGIFDRRANIRLRGSGEFASSPRASVCHSSKWFAVPSLPEIEHAQRFTNVILRRLAHRNETDALPIDVFAYNGRSQSGNSKERQS
jgi:hypothetical protein